jgi:hypothetical protein
MTTLNYADALERLESDLLTPIVPGELVSWLGTVSESAQFAGAMLWRHVEGDNQSDYAEIIAQDTVLFARVEQLKAGDRDCYRQMETLLDHLVKFQRESLHQEWNESMARFPVETLIKQGLAWVIEAKRQEKSRETWFNEAFQRDRGGGD